MKNKIDNDRIFSVSTILVFVVLILVPLCPGTAEESTATQTVRNFLSKALKTEAVIITEKPDIFFENGLPGKTFCIGDKCNSTVMISDDSTTILSYERKNYWAEERDFAQGKSHSDAISESNAFTIALPVLEFMEYSTDRADYSMIFLDTTSNAPGVDDLEGATWIIRKSFSVGEIPCRARAFIIMISAATGSILIISNDPLLLPENEMNVQVPYIIARQNAAEWLKDNFFGNLVGDENSGNIVIAPNEDLLNLDVEVQTEVTKTYYCWEVPFSWKEPATKQMEESVIWVNIETGEVVGASW